MKLYNYLYETLLDDEDDLISKGDNQVIKILADKIFNGTTSYKIENDGSVSYFGVLSSTSLYCKDIIKNIFSGKYLNYFKKFSAISIYDNCIISDILTNPITIDKMDWEKIDEYMSFIKKNNKVKHIYVIDVTESTRTKFRDKFIKAKKIN